MTFTWVPCLQRSANSFSMQAPIVSGSTTNRTGLWLWRLMILDDRRSIHCTGVTKIAITYISHRYRWALSIGHWIFFTLTIWFVAPLFHILSFVFNVVTHIVLRMTRAVTVTVTSVREYGTLKPLVLLSTFYLIKRIARLWIMAKDEQKDLASMLR